MRNKSLIAVLLLTSPSFCCAQQLIYSDTIGLYTIAVEKNGEVTTVLTKSQEKTDTVWHSQGGTALAERVCYTNIFDGDKFAMLYSTLGNCVYLVLERIDGRWQPGLSTLINGDTQGYCPWVKVVDAQTVHARQGGIVLEYKINLEDKTVEWKKIRKKLYGQPTQSAHTSSGKYKQ